MAFTRYIRVSLYCLFLLTLVSSCSEESASPLQQFTLLSSSKSGISFANDLKFRRDFNIYTYRNFYNGGGVAVGDVNNDGWVDIYLTANMLPNRLYLNNGDLSFKDVTQEAGVSGNKSWSTGVSMVDINGDTWLDIYVCNSGDVEGDNKQNELFINQGDGRFIEQAEEYGLADQGLSTHAAFFDFDRDGDLDAYLLNNSFQSIGSFNLRKNERPVRHEEGGDKLYRNDDGLFTDISEEAGIYGSVIGFGLGVTVGDIDLDGWQDLYISNDFFERDYIYMNNRDGTFTESLENQMKSISGASMGADMADINNDGYPEIFVTEMLPEPNERLKTKTTFENWDRYQYNLENGYYHQFTRNMLHLNNGDRTFSEIGRMAGVEATDWSWGALITDFDNDGLKDLFIANGIYKDLTDQDYINYISTEEMAKAVITREGVDFQTLTEVIPSNKIPNYMYRNTGSFQFENVTEKWGLSKPSHSNGSAYADLDNDGDLDLVINNVNEVASVYINNNEKLNPGNGFLKIILEGAGQNTQAVGTRIILHCGISQYSFEQVPIRGFQSSVDPRPNFGVGAHDKIDSLLIYWPDGNISKMTDITVNQTIRIAPDESTTYQQGPMMNQNRDLFVDITEESGIDFRHRENIFVDFDRDRLLYHMLSAEGPALCSGDLNGDGRIDFFIGGARDQPGVVFIQTQNGSFQQTVNSVFEADKVSEDVDCACFDADQDGDLDIYVASGGNEFPNSSSALIDRLYMNNGRARFVKSDQILPGYQFENTSVVRPADIDLDGDLDLFVGVRARPFLIGVPADGYILVNDGKGFFSEKTEEIAPGLKNLGMITNAIWSDIDLDGQSDLMVVGEWLGIKLFQNNGGLLEDVSTSMKLDSTNGWWSGLASADLDADGDTDFVLGNHGLNSRFKASKDRPIQMYVNDYDKNGTAEAIICRYFGENAYPLCLKHDLIAQIPELKKKYVKYEAFKDATIRDIFSEEQLDNAVKSEAYILESIVLINQGERGFKIVRLPKEAQISPVFAIAVDDFNKDENLDILLGGNFYMAKPEVGRYDASYGVYLQGDGNGNFRYVANQMTGLNLDDQVRELEIIDGYNNKKMIIVARNDTTIKAYVY